MSVVWSVRVSDRGKGIICAEPSQDNCPAIIRVTDIIHLDVDRLALRCNVMSNIYFQLDMSNYSYKDDHFYSREN